MTRSRKRKLKRIGAQWAGMPVASALLASSGVVHAQQAEQGVLEEVVVTAQKRSEDLQKVPISLQVLSTEKLEQLQVTSFDDYAKFLPSVSFKSLGPSQAQLFFRGISTGGGSPLHAGALPTTGVYLDETPVTTIGGNVDVHVYDIARVEALAGPQGTLYGASSLSGTLRIITNKPDPSGFSAGYDLKVNKFAHDGDFGDGIEGFVNIPLNDKAAVRLVGYYDHDGGYISNVLVHNTYQRYDGTSVVSPLTVDNSPIVKKNANETDSYGGRAALKVDLNDNWSITPMLMYQHQVAAGNFSYDPKLGDLNVGDFFFGYNRDQWYQSSLTVQGKISNFDLLYSGSWFERKTDNIVDYTEYTVAYDALAFVKSYHYTRFADANGNLIDPSQNTTNHDKYTKMSHEFRINTPQDWRVRGVMGAFYQRQTDNIRAEFRIPNLPAPFSIDGQPGIFYLSAQDRTDRDYAVFTEWTGDITDQLKITGGIRKFWVNNTLYGFFGFNNDGYSKDGEFICTTPITNDPSRPCVNTDKKVVENGETHKVNITYQIDPDHMVYGTYSTGFRPGGNNRRTTALAYAADRLTNFEIGSKTSWFDRRLRINGAIFWEKWKGAQVGIQGSNGITSILNAGNAEVKGIEGDVTWLALDGLTLSMSGTYLLKAETTSDFCAPTLQGTARDSCDASLLDAPAGTQLPVTPKLKVNGTARYTWKSGGYENFVQTSVIHQGSSTFSLEAAKNAVVGDTPHFTSFDASAGTGTGNWKLEAYIENIFDKRGELSRVTECADGLHVCDANYRVYGIKPFNVGVRFGQKF